MSPYLTTFFIVLLVFATTISVEAGGRCAPGEVWTECGKHLRCQKTCESIRKPSGIVCTTECVKGCVCAPGRVRRSQTNEECVPESSC